MAKRKLAGQAFQGGLIEGLRHQSHRLVHSQLLTVTHRDARALLATVLQGIETEVGQIGDILTGGLDAEQTTLLMHPFLGEPVTADQNGVSQAARRVSRGTRISEPTWKSSPPTTPMACRGT